MNKNYMNKDWIAIVGSPAKKIEKAIEEKIKEGYIPYYDDLQVVDAVDGNGTDYLQIMIKVKSTPLN